uniref:Biliverdin-producing heme oxygenase n=1 Tax=Gongylonema pulchrum TaxID=637853 RepID=A0A183DIK2_9BILA
LGASEGFLSSYLYPLQAAVITRSICDKTGELGCHARHFEAVHEGSGTAEFWRLLGLDIGKIKVPKEYVPDNLLDLCEPFENVAARLNTVYEVSKDYALHRISEAEM